MGKYDHISNDLGPDVTPKVYLTNKYSRNGVDGNSLIQPIDEFVKYKKVFPSLKCPKVILNDLKDAFENFDFKRVYAIGKILEIAATSDYESRELCEYPMSQKVRLAWEDLMLRNPEDLEQFEGEDDIPDYIYPTTREINNWLETEGLIGKVGTTNWKSRKQQIQEQLHQQGLPFEHNSRSRYKK